MGRIIPVSPTGDWECPCGQEPPKKKNMTLTPVQAIVALREPFCLFCGRKQQEEWRRTA